jgi:hypothetical protein
MYLREKVSHVLIYKFQFLKVAMQLMDGYCKSKPLFILNEQFFTATNRKLNPLLMSAPL